MYEELQISVLEKGGYTATSVNRQMGSYNPTVVAFSSKADLLKWLDINLEDRSPDLVDRRPQMPAAAKTPDDEIPY